MPARIVVIHSSSPSSVVEAARVVHQVIRGWGVGAELRAWDQLETLYEFDSAIICGSMGVNGWRDEALLAVRRFRYDLEHMSVAYLVGLSPELHGDLEDRPIRRAMGYALDWFNDIRPVKVGLFHFGRGRAADEIRGWAEGLRMNFLQPFTLESASGIRRFLDEHPLERGDMSDLPMVGMTRAERALTLEKAPGHPTNSH